MRGQEYPPPRAPNHITEPQAKDLVGVLAERLARISMVNRTVLEILQKSEDGKAALMMRKAAELLVKVGGPW